GVCVRGPDLLPGEYADVAVRALARATPPRRSHSDPPSGPDGNVTARPNADLTARPEVFSFSTRLVASGDVRAEERSERSVPPDRSDPPSTEEAAFSGRWYRKPGPRVTKHTTRIGAADGPQHCTGVTTSPQDAHRRRDRIRDRRCERVSPVTENAL